MFCIFKKIHDIYVVCVTYIACVLIATRGYDLDHSIVNITALSIGILATFMLYIKSFSIDGYLCTEIIAGRWPVCCVVSCIFAIVVINL